MRQTPAIRGAWQGPTPAHRDGLAPRRLSGTGDARGGHRFSQPAERDQGTPWPRSQVPLMLSPLKVWCLCGLLGWQVMGEGQSSPSLSRAAPGCGMAHGKGRAQPAFSRMNLSPPPLQRQGWAPSNPIILVHPLSPHQSLFLP